MQVYFYKATYTKNNVYKLSDFFVSDSFILNPNKMLDLNITPSDGVFTYITSQLTLPDTTSIRDHTHMYVYDYNKIYKIVRIEYVNKQQWRIYLDEDAFLANYQDFKNKVFLITRTNDVGVGRFLGLNDISEVGLDYTTTIVPIHHPTHTGKWLVVTLRITDVSNYLANGIGIILNSNTGSGDASSTLASSSETISTYAALLTKYPEVVTPQPEKYAYFNKRVAVYELGVLSIYESIYYVDRIIWKKRPNTLILASDAFDYGTIRPLSDVVSRMPDVQTVTIAFPYEMFLSELSLVEERKFVLSAEQISGIKVGTGFGYDVLEVKFVDESLLFSNEIGMTYITPLPTDRYERVKRFNSYSTANYRLCPVYEGNTSTPVSYTAGGITYEYTVMVLNAYNNIIDASLSIGVSPTDYEPFKKYELNVYGNNIKIPAMFVNNIQLAFSIGTSIINYAVYSGTDMSKTLATGSFTLQARWQVDQLDLFNQNNPTYKEQFTAGLWQKGIKSIGMGAVGGAVKGGAQGAALGATIGAANTLIDTSFALHNEQLRQKGLELMPDQLLGDSSSAMFLNDTRYGIYWIIKAPIKQSVMLNEYYLRGFPTGIVTNLDNMSTASNGIYGACKYVQGKIIATLKNAYITSEIDNKLQEGVIII